MSINYYISPDLSKIISLKASSAANRIVLLDSLQNPPNCISPVPWRCRDYRHQAPNYFIHTTEPVLEWSGLIEDDRSSSTMFKSSVDVAPNPPSSSADSSSSSPATSPSSQTSSSLHPAAATRKTLHQNIIGKLRPLPFQYRWTIWFDRHTEPHNNNNAATSGSGTGSASAAGDSAYSDRLYVLHEDIADIATFYRVYNNYPWHQIRLRDTVHIFRKGVKPLWEDPENLHGGSWTFRVPKAKSQAFFHELAILTLANELQTAIESGRVPKFRSLRVFGNFL